MLPNANSLRWTPEGDLLFSQFRQGFHLGVVRADESGANQRPIWFPPIGYQMAHHSDLSPDGSTIAIGYMGASTGDSGLQCFVSELPVPEGEPEPIRFEGRECDMRVRFSPDGRWLYFVSERRRAIDRMPLEGGAFRRVVAPAFGIDVIYGFDLTPDGQALIFAAGSSQRSIWLRDATGNERRLTFEGDAHLPRFAPDGESVFYRDGERGGTGTIWRYHLDSGQRERVCSGLEVVEFRVDAAIARIAASTNAEGSSREDLWLCTIDGSEPPRAILQDVNLWSAMAFSPDGQTIFYAESRGPDRFLLSVPVAGGEPTTMAQLPSFSSIVDVSPDGRWVAVTSSMIDRETALYPVDGGEPRFVVRGWDFGWSPDGSSFLFVNDGMVSAAWELANPDSVLVPPGLPEEPDAEWFESVGAVRLMQEFDFVSLSASPVLYEAAYSRRESSSNLFMVDVPDQ